MLKLWCLLALGVVIGTSVARCQLGPPTNGPRCVTECGLALYDEGEGDADETCEAFQQAERDAVAAFHEHVTAPGWHPIITCRAVRDYKVYVYRAPDAGRGSWYDPYNKSQVVGLTSCDLKNITVGVDTAPHEPIDWDVTALRHELAHAVEDCNDAKHELWQEKGILRALGEE
jgi:hypothetical protein